MSDRRVYFFRLGVVYDDVIKVILISRGGGGGG